MMGRWMENFEELVNEENEREHNEDVTSIHCILFSHTKLHVLYTSITSIYPF